jgi:CHAT domain-containing protein/tetratricopeptide (TPR) repeat protein
MTGRPNSWVLLLLISLLAPTLAPAAAPPARPAGKTGPEVEADRLLQQARSQREQGESKEALASALAGVRLLRGIPDAAPGQLPEALELLAELHVEQAEWAEAGRAREEALALWLKLGGPKSWRVASARLAVERGKRMQTLTREQRQRLGQSWRQDATAKKLRWQGKLSEALPPALAAVRAREEILGKNHPDYARALTTLARVYQSRGEYTLAQPLFEEAKETLSKILGENHPLYALALVGLGELYQETGQLTLARPLFEKSLKIRQEALGETHPDCAQALSKLAGLELEMGRPTRARTLYEKSMRIRKEVYGEKRAGYASGLLDLAQLHRYLAEPEKARTLLERALEISRGSVGEAHPLYATCLSQLASVCQETGHPEQARLLFEQVLAIRRNSPGEKHPEYARTLASLAYVYRLLGQPDRAKELLEQALAIRKEVLGEKHPDYAQSLSSLGYFYRDKGEFSRSSSCFEKSLEICEDVLGPRHPRTAAALNALGALYHRLGRDDASWPLSLQATALTHRQLGLTAGAQDELGQLAAAAHLRSRLDLLLSLPDLDPASPALAYQQVLGWKGAVFVRQRLRHHYQEMAGLNNPEVTRKVGELQEACQQLAALSYSQPETPEQTRSRQQSLKRLNYQKEKLERELASLSRPFQRAHQAEHLTPALLQRSLPPHVALVDFLEYTHQEALPRPGKQPTQRRLTAFVVRHDSLVRLDLGPAQPIADNVGAWRGSIGRRTQPCSGPEDTAAFLRNALWQPLQPHLKGVKIVLISPDGALSRLPFAALPNAAGDRYLVEEDPAVVIFPVPQILPEVLADVPGKKPEPSLLLVGNIDYDSGADAGPEEEAVRGRAVSSLPRSPARSETRSGAWVALPATRQEVASIKDSFTDRFPSGKVTDLRKDKASVAAVRKALPAGTFAHLATHGFFSQVKAPGPGDLGGGERLEALGWHPGLLSGLVLAGANKPDREGAGVLTALEVAELDLHNVDLAVLSACETALGKVAEGEGVLGLQRSFQMAGARATVTSLWKVDDDATRRLMVEFYARLWDGKPSGRLEALRQAQRLMLEEGSKRAMVRSDEKEEGVKRVPPLYWAGFVLAGDWR